MRRAIAAVVAALAALTGLVLAGALTRLDDWAIDHVMPALDPRVPDRGILQWTGLWRPFRLDLPWWQKLLDLYLYPASALVSALVLALAASVLLRRGLRGPALTWVGAWCAVNLLEVAGKHFLERPAVAWSNGPQPVHVQPFDHSYPSGHTARAFVAAAAVAYTWPLLRRAALAWLPLVPVALVVGGDHTVSDVAGGALLGLAAVLGGAAMIRAWTRSPASSSVSSAASSESRSPSSRTSPASASSSRPAS